jgi:Family of unknown function (DUF5681)
MPLPDQAKPFQWKLGQSGNPAGRPKKAQGLDAVMRLEILGVDPLAEAIALANDTSIPKATRLKAWLALVEYAYPRLGAVSVVDDKQTPAIDEQAELLKLIKS